MEQKSETRLRFQSEWSKCWGGLFRLQNQISDCKIQIKIGQKERNQKKSW